MTRDTRLTSTTRSHARCSSSSSWDTITTVPEEADRKFPSHLQAALGCNKASWLQDTVTVSCTSWQDRYEEENQGTSGLVLKDSTWNGKAVLKRSTCEETEENHDGKAVYKTLCQCCWLWSNSTQPGLCLCSGALAMCCTHGLCLCSGACAMCCAGACVMCCAYVLVHV
jgi:hypothetical protein